MIKNFNSMLTNDIVSFEQLDPDFSPGELQRILELTIAGCHKNFAVFFQ